MTRNDRKGPENPRKRGFFHFFRSKTHRPISELKFSEMDNGSPKPPKVTEKEKNISPITCFPGMEAVLLNSFIEDRKKNKLLDPVEPPPTSHRYYPGALSVKTLLSEKNRLSGDATIDNSLEISKNLNIDESLEIKGERVKAQSGLSVRFGELEDDDKLKNKHVIEEPKKNLDKSEVREVSEILQEFERKDTMPVSNVTERRLTAESLKEHTESAGMLSVVVNNNYEAPASDYLSEISSLDSFTNNENTSDYLHIDKQNAEEILHDIKLLDMKKSQDHDKGKAGKMNRRTSMYWSLSERERMTKNTSYSFVPMIEMVSLGKGGISIETSAIGRIQFGIPPETIKDSMLLGLSVPRFYIVPVDRFCRQMGHALGINLAEFEFPAYFNFFVGKKSCMLITDNVEAEKNIRRVFNETLYGPDMFRNGTSHNPEDFAPSYPKDAIPDLAKELQFFRKLPGSEEEFELNDLIEFSTFTQNAESQKIDDQPFGVPPREGEESSESKETELKYSFSDVITTGEVCVLYPPDGEDIGSNGKLKPRVEIFKMPGGTEYIVHDIDENNNIIGLAVLDGLLKVPDCQKIDGFNESPTNTGLIAPSDFVPPQFGLTVLGNSHGFDAKGSTSGYVLWINGRGIMIDPPPYSLATLKNEGINSSLIIGIILTHCHADHDAGAFQKILEGRQIVFIATPTIYKSFITKYSALSGLPEALLRYSHRHRPAIIGKPFKLHGATLYFSYSLHSIPCVSFVVKWKDKSMAFTGDTLLHPPSIEKMENLGILSKSRADALRDFALQPCDLLFHEAGVPPLHTPLEELMKLPEEIKSRLYVVHTASLPEGCGLKSAPIGISKTLRLCNHEESSANQGDAWFRLNLLASVPFIENLNFSDTMELLESAHVEYFKNGEIVVPCSSRNDLLCVIWEGICSEKLSSNEAVRDEKSFPSGAFWNSGSWSGPLDLQPGIELSGESANAKTHDIIAISEFGVKAVLIEMSELYRILKTGSIQYNNYAKLSRGSKMNLTSKQIGDMSSMHVNEINKLHIPELLQFNSTMKKFSHVQRRHFACLNEGLKYFSPNEKLWRRGGAVTNAYLIVSGTVSFTYMRRDGYSNKRASNYSFHENSSRRSSVDSGSSQMALNAKQACKELSNKQPSSKRNDMEFDKLERRLRSRADKALEPVICNTVYENEVEVSFRSNQDSKSCDSNNSCVDYMNNQMLEQLFIKKCDTQGLILSRGHFLGDISKMMGSRIHENVEGTRSSSFASSERTSSGQLSLHDDISHSSSVSAGRDGCVVVVFPSTTLVPYLDKNPCVLFSLHATQVLI